MAASRAVPVVADVGPKKKGRRGEGPSGGAGFGVGLLD